MYRNTNFVLVLLMKIFKKNSFKITEIFGLPYNPMPYPKTKRYKIHLSFYGTWDMSLKKEAGKKERIM